MNRDVTARTRAVPVTPDHLRAAGVGLTADGDYPLRLRAELEPEPDGTPAVGLYLDARPGRKWACVSEGWADTADDAGAFLSRLDQLFGRLDPYYPAWVSYHGADPDGGGRGWVWRYSAARAAELGLSSYEIARRAGGAMTEETVRRYLTGRQGLGVAKWEAIAHVLGITLAVG